MNFDFFGDYVFIVILALALVLGWVGWIISKSRKKIKPASKEISGAAKAPLAGPIEPVKLPPLVSKKTWSERLAKGLSKTRLEIWGKIENIFTQGHFNEATMEELEELLYGADLGPQLVSEMLSDIRVQFSSNAQSVDVNVLKAYFYQKLKSRIGTVQDNLPLELFDPTSISKKPVVIMIVGVNGVGKTTTIGKLATRLSRQGAKVVVGACDTFRAAAVDQLEVWCQRAGAQMVRAKEGSSPSGVGYDSLQIAIQQQADYCILDTAGRLHTKENLMDELKKSKEVLAKLDLSSPHHVLLVLDAITGQNALKQAQEFHKFLGLTGLIFTKCDGSSKAGSAIAIVQDLKVPITYIGVGEDVDDLDRFDLDEYLASLLNYGPKKKTPIEMVEVPLSQ